MKTVTLALALAIVLLLAAPASALSSNHKTHIRNKNGTSSNWSGYAAFGSNGSFNNVSASWTQPAVTCGAQNTYSSYWVGLDGYNNSTVEQLGTESDCSNGVPSYYAWYEMYPKRGYYINMTIHANDNMTASVTYNGSGRFTLSIKDLTSGKSFSTTQRANSAKRASAEVIVEAPYSGGTLPLANFGTANFTNALANGNPLGGSSNLDAITMQNPYGMTSTPSSFDTTNKNFSVVWSSN